MVWTFLSCVHFFFNIVLVWSFPVGHFAVLFRVATVSVISRGYFLQSLPMEIEADRPKACTVDHLA